MTIFRAPLANSKGEVMLSMQATGVIPAQAVQFRGLWVTMNNLVCATNDTGQARKYVGGFALEDPSGLLLVTETAPASVPMDGINANAAGTVVTKTGAGSVVHQGVGMTVSAPGGPLVITQEEPTLTFYAGLQNQINSGMIQGAFSRSSQATTKSVTGQLAVVGNSVPRFGLQDSEGEFPGILMEPAKTNVSPQKTVFTRDTNMIVENGLSSALSSDIKVSRWQATPDDTSHYVSQSLIDLVSVNNTYSFSVFIKNTGENAGAFRIKYQGGFSQARTELYYDFLKDTIDRVDTFGTTPNTLHDYGVEKFQDGWRRVWFVITINFDPFPSPSANIFMAPLPDVSLTGDGYDGAAGNFSVYVTGFSVVEEYVISSYIHGEEGSASSRALDQCSWPLTDPQGRNILNQTEGMAAILWQPTYDPSVWPNANEYVNLLTADDRILTFLRGAVTTRTFRSISGANIAEVAIPGGVIAANDLFLVMARWAAAGFQVGYKKAGEGVYRWSTSQTFGGFAQSGILKLNDKVTPPTVRLPDYLKQAYVWSEDKGTAWLESFFSGVAN